MSKIIKFSKRTLYAIKCLIHLHAYHGQGVISAQSISQNQQIPERFLNSILGILKKKGWIKSRQGPNGGYFLDEATHQISLKEIIEELEIKTLEPEEAGELNRRSRISEEIIYQGLSTMDEALNEHARHITLSELSRRYSERLSSENETYTI